MTAADLLVVGGGPAGCAAAIRAAQGGLATVVVDRPRPGRSWPGESLPPGMGKLVRSVFGEAILSEEHHRPAFGSRASWGSGDLVETDFVANPLGEGWLLDRPRFDAAAREAAIAAGVAVHTLRGAVRLSHRRAAWQLDAADGSTIAARFVVDATGRAAALMRQLGIRRFSADGQVAIVASVPDEGDAYQGTTVEAVREGWWYTTPLPGGRRVLAFLTDADLWRDGERDWQAVLSGTRHIGRIAGPAVRVARPRACPADTAIAERIAGPDWLAVGDAAAAFDPLSSQGLATAVLMGARAGEALAASDRAGAIEAWAEAYAMLVAEHADLRTHYARLETRWPDSVFWRRRQQPDETLVRRVRNWPASVQPMPV